MTTLQNLTPHSIWRFFDEITRVPRPSGREEKIIDYLLRFARERGLESRKDAAGNVVIVKPASPGRAGSPTVVLQSHMDMVCEKNAGIEFDFFTDPIRTYVENGWVRARGTTLGADCGIGMAAALAALDSGELVHGPIEALFTVDEERGLTGANELVDDMITGRLLINLDSEEEGEITIGCAGGIDTTAVFRFEAEPVPEKMKMYRASLSGLAGGHSGEDIGRGLANANKLLGRFLLYGAENYGLRISSIDGGNLRNAIPREAWCVFGLPEGRAGEMVGYAEEFREMIQGELVEADARFDFRIGEAPAGQLMDADSQKRLLLALNGVFNGVFSMSRSIPELVEASSNLASVKGVGGNRIAVATSQRSSSESMKQVVMKSVESVFALAGAEVRHSDGYPGWEPRPSSPLLATVRGVYASEFGKEPKVKAIHAGLECGLFLRKFPELDMVSIGPTVTGAHSPDEGLEVSSVGKFWTLLTAVLGKLA